MPRREGAERGPPLCGQRHAHDSVIGRVDVRADDPCLFCPVDELAGAVVTHEELRRDLSDGRPGWAQSPDHDEELVLRRREPRGQRLLFAPLQEPAKRGPEREESLVVDVRGRHADTS